MLCECVWNCGCVHSWTSREFCARQLSTSSIYRTTMPGWRERTLLWEQLPSARKALVCRNYLFAFLNLQVCLQQYKVLLYSRINSFSFSLVGGCGCFEFNFSIRQGILIVFPVIYVRYCLWSCLFFWHKFTNTSTYTYSFVNVIYYVRCEEPAVGDPRQQHKPWWRISYGRVLDSTT